MPLSRVLIKLHRRNVANKSCKVCFKHLRACYLFTFSLLPTTEALHHTQVLGLAWILDGLNCLD